MKSRISFFDRTVLGKDITRFAPVWGLYLIGGLLVGLNTISGYQVGWAAMNLMDSLNALSAVNLVYAAVCAQMLFGDLFNSKLCNALHALPLRRETWFVTHSLSGLAFSLVPNLILSLCFLPMVGECWYLSFAWLLGMELQYLFFFGLAVLSCMLTGNRIGMALVYGVINFCSAIVYWFVKTFYEPLLPGLIIQDKGFLRYCPVMWANSWMGELAEFEWITPLSGSESFYGEGQYIYKGMNDGWWYLAVLAGLGAVALVLGVALYRRRKLESAGDLLAFKPLEPFFAVIATLSTGAVFQFMGEMMVSDSGYIYLAVGIPVGYFVSRMLMERRVKVFRKKAFLGCGAIVAAMGLTLLLTWLDPIGITRWVPEPERVGSIKIVDVYDYHEDFFHSEVITVDDPALIATLTQAHEYLTEEGRNGWQKSRTVPVTLLYEMKNGQKIYRHYFYPEDGKAAETIGALFSDPKYVLGYEDWELFVQSVEMVGVNWGSDVTDEERIRQLLEAIRADCEAGTMAQTRSYDVYALGIQISFYDKNSLYLDIYEDCTNTLAWVKENFPDLEYGK